MEIAKNKLNSSTIEKYIMIFVLIVVLFKIVAALFPEAQSAGDELNSSGMPLGSFFASGGIIWLLVAAGLLFLVYKSFMSSHK